MALSDPSEDSGRLAEELRGLAIELHRRHYSHVPQWKASSTPRGLVSQIDNMTAGMAMWIEQLEAAISWVSPLFVDEETTEKELRARIKFLVRDSERKPSDNGRRPKGRDTK